MRRTRLLVLGLCCHAIAAFPVTAVAQPTCEGALVAEARPPALMLSWTGGIRDPMAECIQDAFDRLGGPTSYVNLSIDSEGGYLPDMERVIATLKNIQRTHPLLAVVGHGGQMLVGVRAGVSGGKVSRRRTGNHLDVP